MTPGDLGPVVVGVDGDDRSVTALCWAAYQAELDNRPLILVHAQTEVNSWALASGMVGAFAWDHPDIVARRVLDSAVDLARRLAPGVVVTARTEPVSPARLVLAEAGETSLIVLGNHGARLMTDVVVGTVCGTVAARASCPVIAVSGRPAWPDAPIVIGLDESGVADRALDFALALAARRHVPVRLHHIRRHHTRAEGVQHPVFGEPYRYGWLRARHPEVPVRITCATGDPVAALADAAADAQLLVIGTRGHSSAAGLLTGSVSHALLRKAPCALAIVPRTPQAPTW
ncbi:MAG TPA: universal stress protein [Pseudonocardiaceae bacterium]|jgi:nucleotide-binding universal stress UspA family protein|nr:universal stress protein [Pseudonocardiaceae bacterium]